tara:strand:- start:3752 stop:4546 length:795 start_codon:yes stop_codon:yes gene_type:complete
MNFEKIASKLRYRVIQMSSAAKTAHLASALSCIDILTVLYEGIIKFDSKNPKFPDRDRFILSKGHAATALYAILNYKGIISDDELRGYSKKDSLLEEHPSPKLPGVEAATGSLGHGLAIGNGMALAAKIKNKKYKTYILLSDGECNEGSVWEAAMFSPMHSLDSLTAIVDFNKWQATGRSREVLNIDSMIEKWKSFGWHVLEIDGHNHHEIKTALQDSSENKPKMVIANTIKGKGVSFMEDDNNWHYRSPTSEEVELAKIELKL